MRNIFVCWAILMPGCFAPEYHSGNLSCSPDGQCPPAFVCGPDRHCYRPEELPDLAVELDLSGPSEGPELGIEPPIEMGPALKTLGEACTGDTECQLGHCVDGYCCESTCPDQCEACDVSGSLGKCVQVTGAPHGSRTACGNDGSGCGGTCGSSTTACDYPGASVSCRTQSCTNSVKTLAAMCDGKGACPAPQTESCGAFVCNGNDCYTSCSGNPQCVSPAVCISGVCKGQLSNGSPCSGNGECVSGFCADGYCCNDDCRSQCEACNLSGSLGVCSQVTGAPKPGHTACTGTGTTCGGTCGSCRTACNYPTTQCRASSCSGGTETLAANCSSGSCPSVQTQTCGAYVCDATACKTTCASDADCAMGYYCSGTGCVAKKTNGTTCSSPNQCMSNFCVDGYCCNSDCPGKCEACNLSGKLGTCSPVPNGSQPSPSKGMCIADGTICGGYCDGTTTADCSYPMSGQCRAPSCTSGTATLAASCKGTGKCPALQTQTCSPYICDATACKTSCANDGDCISGYYCSGGSCVAKKGQGASCSSGNECSNGLCYDGYCCNKACTGACERCDYPGSQGQCNPVPLNGAIRHGSCNTDSTYPMCNGYCNGSSTGCTYPTSSTACGRCSHDSFFTPYQNKGTCNGNGACTNIVTTKCSPYECNTSTFTCYSAPCSSNSQCASGYSCSTCPVVGCTRVCQ